MVHSYIDSCDTAMITINQTPDDIKAQKAIKFIALCTERKFSKNLIADLCTLLDSDGYKCGFNTKSIDDMIAQTFSTVSILMLIKYTYI